MHLEAQIVPVVLFVLTACAAPSVVVTDHPLGRVHGVFVGISDYESGTLEDCAADARKFAHVLHDEARMRICDGFVLCDQDASVSAVRTALHTMVGRVGPDDVFVFFFSGHGNQVLREGPFAADDPDGLDETITLVDGSLRDDELRELLDGLAARVALVVIDSCHSGGFRPDLISVRARRVGLFSCRENELSKIPVSFDAGGYLAHYAKAAVRDRRADDNGDGALSAREICDYVRRRYAADRDALPEQHLTHGLRGVAPDTVLFRMRPRSPRAGVIPGAGT